MLSASVCKTIVAVKMFVLIWYLLFTLLIGILGEHPVPIDKSKTLLWGPGLKPEIATPARYFFIQAVDHKGDNITQDLGENAFQVSFSHGDGRRARVGPQVLNRHDGSYIVRYKVHETLHDARMKVTYHGEELAGSPFIMQGYVYGEKCFCPEEGDVWHEAYQCPASYRQIDLDLQVHYRIAMEYVRKEAVERFSEKGRHALCHYVIKDNKVYRKTYGQHVGFKMFSDAMLLSLTRKVKLPDIEFFVNLGDWPLEKRRPNEGPLPIFSWCGSDDTLDIIMPTYDVTESTLETMGRVTLDLLSVQANTGPRWENKSDIAFFRGRDSRQERLDLVKLSRKHPDIIDAKLTNMFFFKHDQEELGEIVKHISFFDFFKRKYQVNLDGTVAAYRFPYLLAGDSLILKQDSPYYEHYYKSLKPYVHYVPFKRDLSDLMEKIQWAKDHDDQAREIAKAGQQFVRDSLMGVDIFCYHYVLFQEYAKRLLSPVEVLEGMELVEQPNDWQADCDCHRLPKEEEKEHKKKDEL